MQPLFGFIVDVQRWQKPDVVLHLFVDNQTILFRRDVVDHKARRNKRGWVKQSRYEVIPSGKHLTLPMNCTKSESDPLLQANLHRSRPKICWEKSRGDSSPLSRTRLRPPGYA